MPASETVTPSFFAAKAMGANGSFATSPSFLAAIAATWRDARICFIDAVKAFTQSDVNRGDQGRTLHVEMPIGFSVPGYVLLLNKALEGIKQGSYLWFQKNKAAWNRCGLFADLVEPDHSPSPQNTNCDITIKKGLGS